jgi:hypothetical protein
MSDDVFAADQQPVENDSAPTQQDPINDKLREILNEEGVQKYKSIEDAIEGLKASQDFIGKLKQENQEFRSELDKRMSAEAVLAELKQGKEPSEQPSPQVDPDAVSKLVDQRIEAKSMESRAKQNEDRVQQEFRNSFGEKAQEIVQRKAAELGMTSEALRSLSQESPDAVLKMFDVASKPQTSVPSRTSSSVRSEALGQTGTQTGTYRWWQNLRRENPTEYTKRYMEYMTDAEKPGFYD